MRYSPNLYPAYGDAYRDGDGEFFGSVGQGAGGGTDCRTIPDELVVRIGGGLTDAEADSGTGAPSLLGDR